MCERDVSFLAIDSIAEEAYYVVRFLGYAIYHLMGLEENVVHFRFGIESACFALPLNEMYSATFSTIAGDRCPRDGSGTDFSRVSDGTAEQAAMSSSTSTPGPANEPSAKTASQPSSSTTNDTNTTANNKAKRATKTKRFFS